MKFVTWDVETSTNSSFKRKANPFDLRNIVVATGWATNHEEVQADYFGRFGKRPFDWFIRMLNGTNLLVGQNIKFDLLYALREPHNLEAWMKWVANGGNVWDVQLAEYLLQGMIQTSQMMNLDELSVLYGGTLKVDEVKRLWEAGVATEDIEPDLLMRYLQGGKDENGIAGEGDIGNTRLVFLGQLAKARKSKQVKSILLNMGSLLCTIEMERNGMAVDRPRGLILAEKLSEQLNELKERLQNYLPSALPFEFNWGSRFHLSALIFGGQVRYSAPAVVIDAESGEPSYYQMKESHYLLSDGTTTAITESSPPPENVQRNKGGKNTGEPKTKIVTVPDVARGPKTRIEDHFYKFKGFTKPAKQWETDTDGVWSTAGEVLEALANRDIPFLKDLGAVAGIAKNLGTYFITTDAKTGLQKGMLTLVDAEGLIHHMLNHTATVTGRFSSSNPNLQNLPKGDKSEAKSLFVSRFDGGSVIQSDFSSLEIYVQANLTNCMNLVRDLIAGLDMHCKKLAAKEGKTYEEVCLLCKGDETKGIKPVKEWIYKRGGAKSYSFQVAYGAGVDKIAADTGMPVEDVQGFLDADKKEYPETFEFFDRLGAQLHKTRTRTEIWVQHDVSKEQVRLHRAHWQSPTGKIYAWTETTSPDFVYKRTGRTTSFTPTQVKNYPVQGEGGEWAKAAMWLAVRAFYREKNFNQFALLVNQVHDALYADSDETTRVVAASLLHACMMEASTFIEYYFGWELHVPVPSETTYGSSMMEEKKIGADVLDKATAWRDGLRRDYMNNYTPTWERNIA